MIIKAFYYLDDEPIKSVKFEADAKGQPEDKKVIYNNAPERWDVCKWDHGEVKPKKVVKKPLEEAMENIVSDDE